MRCPALLSLSAAHRWRDLTAGVAVFLLLLLLPVSLGVADEGDKTAGEDSDKQQPVQQRGQEPEPEDTETASKEENGSSSPARFTNEDLPPVHPADAKNAGASSRDQESEESEEDSQETLDEVMDAAAKETLDTHIAATRKQISLLEMRLSHLESRIKSIRNPFLKGLTPPSDEETDAVGGLSNPERLAWVEEQIALSQAALDEARMELLELLRQ